MDKYLIYAVDDEEPIRELYSCALQGSGFNSKCFENGQSLFEALLTELPNLIILDVMLDGQDGFEILNELKSKDITKNIPVIMVSAKGEEISKVKGLNLGADDYMSKPFGVLELIARINVCIKRTVKTNNLTYKDIVVDNVKHAIIANNVTLSLTLKEFNLLKYFVAHPEESLSRDQILDNVWGEEFFTESRTLDVHIKEIRKALSSANSSATINTIRSVGFILT